MSRSIRGVVPLNPAAQASVPTFIPSCGFELPRRCFARRISEAPRRSAARAGAEKGEKTEEGAKGLRPFVTRASNRDIKSRHVSVRLKSVASQLLKEIGPLDSRDAMFLGVSITLHWN